MELSRGYIPAIKKQNKTCFKNNFVRRDSEENCMVDFTVKMTSTLFFRPKALINKQMKVALFLHVRKSNRLKMLC